MCDGIRVILEPACRSQGIEPTACAVFWLVLPFREGGILYDEVNTIFLLFSKSHPRVYS